MANGQSNLKDLQVFKSCQRHSDETSGMMISDSVYTDVSAFAITAENLL